jgi:hypothetical protein
MDLSDILDVFQKSDGPSTDLEALRVWLEAAVVLAHAQAAPSLDTDPLSKHFAALPPTEAQRLSWSLPAPTAGNVYLGIEGLRHAQVSTPEDAARVLRTVDGLDPIRWTV